jgi:hypothetical protein
MGSFSMGLTFERNTMSEVKTYYRVESYEGCAMTPSGRFESREDADEYARTHPAADSRIIKVNEDGAAI